VAAAKTIKTPQAASRQESLAPGASLLRGFALPVADALAAAVDRVAATAPFRHFETRGGFRMSVAMTNCGNCGWVSDRRGYRYESCDPSSGSPWPCMPDTFLALAGSAAAAGGFAGFAPDVCLINRYVPGARMTLHQDRDEANFEWPIVSVSLGLPAVFLFGGDRRSDRHRRIPLDHGDVLVWGGTARLHHHGVLPLNARNHATVGALRLNLTFRRAR
jgi:alkylated DNA repair protein (DNA oxidative demethylase)